MPAGPEKHFEAGLEGEKADSAPPGGDLSGLLLKEHASTDTNKVETTKVETTTSDSERSGFMDRLRESAHNLWDTIRGREHQTSTDQSASSNPGQDISPAQGLVPGTPREYWEGKTDDPHALLPAGSIQHWRGGPPESEPGLVRGTPREFWEGKTDNPYAQLPAESIQHWRAGGGGGGSPSNQWQEGFVLGTPREYWEGKTDNPYAWLRADSIQHWQGIPKEFREGETDNPYAKE
ncbi:MAG: hypothetical protein J2P37_07270 [Ktedonobacteraceae bacterium]|nr:hypothetical protein [Ktedonobacteraceae bacterium]